jgi:hypothetical protein
VEVTRLVLGVVWLGKVHLRASPSCRFRGCVRSAVEFGQFKVLCIQGARCRGDRVALLASYANRVVVLSSLLGSRDTPHGAAVVCEVGAATRTGLRTVVTNVRKLDWFTGIPVGTTAERTAEPSCKQSALQQLRQWRRNVRAASRIPSPSGWLPAMVSRYVGRLRSSKDVLPLFGAAASAPLNPLVNPNYR